MVTTVRGIFCAFILVNLGFLLVNCGGSSSDSGQGGQGGRYSERPKSSVYGIGADALIVDGLVNVYVLNTDGTVGENIGSGRTGDQGRFIAEGIQSADTPIILELTGGCYREEASLNEAEVCLKEGEKLRAVSYYSSGDGISVMITPLTNDATALALYKIEQGESTANAVAAAVSAVSGVAGFDIFTEPLNITDVANLASTPTDGHHYGFYLASISEFMKRVSVEQGLEPYGPYPAIRFTAISYDDIRFDGMRDGIGSNGEIFIGTYRFNADTYRKQLGIAQAVIANSEANATGITVSGLIDSINLRALSTDSIYPAEVIPGPVDTVGPEINSDDQLKTYSGTGVFTARVTDLVGVSSVEFWIDRVFINTVLNETAPSFTFSTNEYVDGEHEIMLRALDDLDNQTERVFLLYVDNSNPILTVNSPLLTNSYFYTLTGIVSDVGSEVVSVMVEGDEAALNSDGTWSIDVTLLPGINDIEITATDTLSNQGIYNVAVDLDVNQVRLFDFYSEGQFWDEESGIVFGGNLGEVDVQVYPIFIDSSNYTLGDLGLNTDVLDVNSISYIGFGVSDRDEHGVFTSPSNIDLQYNYTLEEEAFSEWRVLPQTDNGLYLFPLVREYLAPSTINASDATDHMLQFRAFDLAGNMTEFRYVFFLHFNLPKLFITSVFEETEIQAFNFSGSARGGEVGRCDTSSVGACDLALSAGAMPLLIEAEREERRIRSYMRFFDEDVALVITPLSEIYSIFVEQNIEAGQDPATAIEGAIAEFGSVYGFNPVLTNIGDLSESVTQFTPEVNHALFIEGINRVVTEGMGSEGSVFEFLALLRNDFEHDGLLDGVGVEQGIEINLRYGTLEIDANTYRNVVATGALDALNELTSIDVTSEVYESINALAMSENAIFGDLAPRHVDNEPPELTVTSEGLVNNPNYTLTGTVSDNREAPVTVVVVQGVYEYAAVVEVNGTWSVELRVERAVNPLTIVATDGASNETEFDYTVRLDVNFPTIYWVYSSGRYSIDGTPTGTFNLDNNAQWPIYFPTSKLYRGSVANTVRELDAAGLMWVSASVEDLTTGGVYTEARDLRVETRYTGFGTREWDSTTISCTVLGYCLIPLTVESFTPGFANADNETHRIRVRVTDAAGNSVESEFVFRVDIVVEQPSVSSEDIHSSMLSRSFSDRQSIANQTVEYQNYGFINHSTSPVLMRVEAGGGHSFTQNYETGQRFNRQRRGDFTDWRKALCSHTDYREIDSVLNFTNNSFVRVYKPASRFSAYTNRTSDGISAGTTAAWESFEIDNEWHRVLMQVNTAFYWRFYDYPDTAYPISENANVIQAGVSKCTFDESNLHRRQRVVYNLEPGYPRNTFSTSSQTTNFSNGIIQVVTNGRNIEPTVDGSWYRIGAGDSVVIKKYAVLPNFTARNHTDVGNRSTFSSYSERTYDLNLRWYLNKPITVTLTHDDGDTDSGEYHHTSFTVASGNYVRTINR